MKHTKHSGGIQRKQIAATKISDNKKKVLFGNKSADSVLYGPGEVKSC